jgi:hypothetical protein
LPSAASYLLQLVVEQSGNGSIRRGQVDMPHRDARTQAARL